MRKFQFFLAILTVLAALVVQAESRKFTCTFKVDKPIVDVTKEKDKEAEKENKKLRYRRPVDEKTVRTMRTPVKVSVRGKERPNEISLYYLFVGKTVEGKLVSLGKGTMEVKLDEKGDFKTELSSEPAIVTEKKGIRSYSSYSSGIGNLSPVRRVALGYSSNGPGRGGYYGGLSKTIREGVLTDSCIIQLIVDGELERGYSSALQWKQLARKYPLPESEIFDQK